MIPPYCDPKCFVLYIDHVMWNGFGSSPAGNFDKGYIHGDKSYVQYSIHEDQSCLIDTTRWRLVQEVGCPCALGTTSPVSHISISVRVVLVCRIMCSDFPLIGHKSQ